jgi:S-adenosylmethionine hydrolase
MTRIITLLTDFGTTDTYVGQVKGAILSINPNACIVDLTHNVQPFQIVQGAFLLETAIGAFPPGTIHMAVVDPGVGGARRGIALASAGRWFVGPDNGILSAALAETHRPAGRALTELAVPPGVEVVELRNRELQRPGVAPTFHGRDIFGPAAAHLSLGVALARFGPRLDRIHALPPFRARPDQAGRIEARIVAIDRFGNLITDARGADLPSVRLVVSGGDWEARGLVSTYAGATGLVALIGSTGYVEIAEPEGSAAGRTGAAIGDGVLLLPA